MAIIASDLQLRLSGGATNFDPLLAKGGALSSSTAAFNLFDNITDLEALSGNVEYRCVYMLNTAAQELAPNRIYIFFDTPSEFTTIEMGLGASAVNVAEPATANTATAPAGVVFTSPLELGDALLIPSLPAGGYNAIWIKRTVLAAAEDYEADGFTLRWTTQQSVVSVAASGYFGDYFGGNF